MSGLSGQGAITGCDLCLAEDYKEENHKRYSTHLYSETDRSPLRVEPVAVQYGENPDRVTGREVIRDNFDALLGSDPRIVIFGEDTGKIGDVNKSLEGLQEKYGELRVTDTGITGDHHHRTGSWDGTAGTYVPLLRFSILITCSMPWKR